MANKTQKIRTIYKVAAFLAFIMLSYLGIRSYRHSVEKLKINACIEEVNELVGNIQRAYERQFSYKDLDYNTAVTLNLIPQRMFKPGYSDAINSFIGGVDMFYSSWEKIDDDKAFEVSFQGVSSEACKELMKIQWDAGLNTDFIAVGGYTNPTPSGVLDEILVNMKQEDIKSGNIFKGTDVRFASADKLERACDCKDRTCSVVWKFH